MLDETDYLIKYSKDLTYEEFIEDDTLRRAFVRSLEIIGEAAKKISPSVKDKYCEIDWKRWAGMRDILIHRYFGVDYEVVWDTVKRKVPQLKDGILKILGIENS
jgi:uncharacterized protein with HEPN domain